MGLVLLGIFIIYVIISITIVCASYYFGNKKNRGWVFALTTALILIVLPVWDVLPAKYYFESLCEKDVGIHIYKTIENVDGFFNKHVRDSGAESILRRNGYKYIEAKNLSKGLARYSLDTDDQLVVVDITKPKSRYSVVQLVRTRLNWNVSQFDSWIEDTLTGEKIALARKYGYFGNWVVRIINSYGGTGATYCPIPRKYISQYYQQVLIPSNN